MLRASNNHGQGVQFFFFLNISKLAANSSIKEIHPLSPTASSTPMHVSAVSPNLFRRTQKNPPLLRVNELLCTYH